MHRDSVVGRSWRVLSKVIAILSPELQGLGILHCQEEAPLETDPIRTSRRAITGSSIDTVSFVLVFTVGPPSESHNQK